jgi:hypothetical protein
LLGDGCGNIGGRLELRRIDFCGWLVFSRN